MTMISNWVLRGSDHLMCDANEFLIIYLFISNIDTSCQTQVLEI